ncbi:MAG TPA: 50S ribosomal protein L28 [Sporichthyaceae bacterium]|jgi:ribosomal protein L28|nr:50S ribosomal protein L28 [Sporichthyaceae bacterium]
MSRICMLTGTAPGFGQAISHSHVRSKRHFDVNIQTRRYYLPRENRTVRLRHRPKRRDLGLANLVHSPFRERLLARRPDGPARLRLG